MRKNLHLVLMLFILMLATVGCGPRDPKAELHRAARLGNETQVSAMLESGEDVNKVVDGKTPLLEAAESVKPKTLALLLKKGADVLAKDSQNRDAWDLVVARGHGRFLSQSQAQALSLLIDSGIQPRITLTQCAVQADSKVLVESLVKAGADVNRADKYGWTALHYAARAGHADCCEALIQSGANANAESTADFTDNVRCPAGSRPLDVVKDRSTKASRSAKKVLLEAGATNNPKVKRKIRY